MSLLLSLLSGYWKYIAIVVFIAGYTVAVWVNGRSSGIESQRPKVQAAESNAALWQTTAKNRLTLLQAQNTAVEALKTAQATRLSLLQNKLAVANSEASKFREVAEKRKNAVLNLPLSENECTALKQLVDEARK